MHKLCYFNAKFTPKYNLLLEMLYCLSLWHTLTRTHTHRLCIYIYTHDIFTFWVESDDAFSKIQRCLGIKPNLTATHHSLQTVTDDNFTEFKVCFPDPCYVSSSHFQSSVIFLYRHELIGQLNFQLGSFVFCFLIDKR